MLDTFIATIIINTKWQIILLVLSAISIIGGLIAIPKVIASLLENLISEDLNTAYEKVIKPDQKVVWIAGILVGTDLVFWLLPENELFQLLEFFVGLSSGITISWLLSRAFRRFFDDYLLDASMKTGRKVNSELLVLAKLIANVLIVIITIIIFAQTHRLNIFGLFASLGVSGIAVAFAAQKTLEQLLGGIVIYVDRPFVVDDYIGLPDGTFGRVESIGLRSTKIRSSGKGTLYVVPNNALNQVTIENFTGAKKVISIIYLTFYRIIPEQEKALIRQVILECTQDIFGIDHRSTQVQFTDRINEEIMLSNGKAHGNGKGIKDSKQAITHAQINFFILGSGETSLDLRQQLLDIAKKNITNQLKEYGISFDIQDKTINVDSPITI